MTTSNSVAPASRPNAALTICARNYFAQALVLAKSFRHFHPECDFYFVIVDRKDEIFAQEFAHLNLIWVEELGLANFNGLALKFDVIELSTNVKPFALGQLLQKHQRVLYLDPDTCLFDRLDEVYEALESASIVVTPASMTPILDGHRPDDIEFLRVGVFNLGFVGVSACAETGAFINWWSRRCLDEGFHETQSGVFVDQKWINLVPCYFPSSRILRDPGLNMAPWNLHERTLSMREGRWIVNGGDSLKFFHFSSFDIERPQTIAKRQTRFVEGERKDLTQILDQYSVALRDEGHERLSRLEYSFDTLPSGEYISPTLRRLYANPGYGFPLNEDPTLPGSHFLELVRRRGWIGKRVGKAARLTAADLSKHSKQIAALGLLFRLALRLLGPNRYFSLMRYLAHASSIRHQPPL